MKFDGNYLQYYGFYITGKGYAKPQPLFNYYNNTAHLSFIKQ